MKAASWVRSGASGSSRVADAPVLLSLLVSSLVAVMYLRWAPLVPDLAAQVARADVVRTSGLTSWWMGWFGGLSLPTYSVLVPPWMAVIGVRGTGVLAVVVGAAGSAVLVRESRRPRAGAIAFAVSGLADLLDGRVTFTAGLAVAAWALVALRSRWTVRTAVLAIAAYFASPLAGLFLGMVLVAIVITDRSRRRPAEIAAAALLIVGVAMEVLFPGTGTMPFGIVAAIPAALCGVGVFVLCPDRTIRIASLIVLSTFPLLLLIPGAVGGNITRLAWVCAVPVVVACAPLPKRMLVVAVTLLAAWPVADLAGQLHSASDPSAQATFYQPLHAQLLTQQASSGAAAIGERIEVVDTANHWASVYLSSMSLARGWDRQADNTDNPIFYKADQLNAGSYHSWLHSLAVGWVAVPSAPLDYASVHEAALVRGGLSYLKLIWSSPDWQLYRVVDAAPLVAGARIDSADGRGITLTTSAATTLTMRVRWSPYLTVRDPSSGLAVPACVTNADGWVNLMLPHAETVELSSQFDPTDRLTRPDADCAADILGK